MQETIPGRFARQAAALGGRPLFLAKRDGAYAPMSWHQAAEDVTRLGALLLHAGVAPGDRVVILSENRPEWAIADLAIQSVGAWSVPIYPSLLVPDIRVICEDCQPVAGIASTPDQLGKLLEISRQLPGLHLLLAIDAVGATPPPVVLWADALAKGGTLAPQLRPSLEQRKAGIRPEDTATLLYTSGTTGEPKGVMLSHRNFLSNVDACLQVIPATKTDVHLSFLPLSHVFERMAGWYLMMSAGACIAYAEQMDAIPQNMLEVHPTVMLGVPRFFEKLHGRIQEGLRQAPALTRRLATWAFRVGRAAAACRTQGHSLPPGLALRHALASALVFHKLKARLGGRLRFFVSGGAPLAKEIGEFFFSAGVTILEGYGLTETSPVIAVNRLPAPTFGSVGEAVADVEVRIAEDGEILVRGPLVMQGYYRKPEATAAVMRDGWFHTGDIGHLDPHGRLFITDRKKDLIKTAGGKFVAPQKLENLLVMDPYISQAFVYGDRRPFCVALIVPNADPLRRYAQEQEITGTSLAQLLAHPTIQEFYWARVQAKQRDLASFEQIKKIALLDQEFSQAGGELTPTLKTKRAIVAERHAALLDSLYCAPAA